MPGPRYPENILFEKTTKAAFDLGKTLPPRKKRRALPQIPDVKPTVPTAPPAPTGSLPTSISGLGRVSVPYGGTTKFEKFHPGVDIANAGGTQIPAFAGGTVTDIRTGQKQTPGTPSFGNYVIITDEAGNKHRYSHLHKSFVKMGQKITPGTPVGAMGSTGSTYSPSGGDPSHLDYRIKDAYGKYVNPLVYLGKLTK